MIDSFNAKVGGEERCLREKHFTKDFYDLYRRPYGDQLTIDSQGCSGLRKTDILSKRIAALSSDTDTVCDGRT
jgi:hypothetical protein